MGAHDVVMLERVAVGHWAIHCACFATVRGTDAIECHRNHQDHVLAEHLAEEYGIERTA